MLIVFDVDHMIMLSTVGWLLNECSWHKRTITHVEEKGVAMPDMLKANLPSRPLEKDMVPD